LTEQRYNAARAAALAAAGQGKDELPLDDAAKAKLRGQALDWLKAELKVWTKLLESASPRARLTIFLALSNWQHESDLAGIRDTQALARLPKVEQTEWQARWAEVAALLKQFAPLPLLHGEIRQDGRYSATLKLFIRKDTMVGEQILVGEGGQLKLEIVGTLSGENFIAKTFKDGEHWSDWEGKLDVKNGTLTAKFTPVSRGLSPYVGTMSLAAGEKAKADADMSLAAEHLQVGKPDLALPFLVDILNVRKARLGPDHPDTLETMTKLGVAYWQLRQLDKSVPLFEELLKSREAALGRDHFQTLDAAGILGVNYLDSGRLKEALPLLEEAYRASKNYPGRLPGYGPRLLDAYAKAGEKAKFANLLPEQLAEARKAHPKDSLQLAGQLAEIGLVLLQQKKWTEAEPLLRECLAIRAKTQPDAWNTFNTKSSLGGALLGQKKYADAEPLLLAGYEGMKKREKTIPPQGLVRLPEAIDRLIELSTATNKPDEVKKWRAERAKYPKVAPTQREKK